MFSDNRVCSKSPITQAKAVLKVPCDTGGLREGRDSCSGVCWLLRVCLSQRLWRHAVASGELLCTHNMIELSRDLACVINSLILPAGVVLPCL